MTWFELLKEEQMPEWAKYHDNRHLISWPVMFSGEKKTTRDLLDYLFDSPYYNVKQMPTTTQLETHLSKNYTRVGQDYYSRPLFQWQGKQKSKNNAWVFDKINGRN